MTSGREGVQSIAGLLQQYATTRSGHGHECVEGEDFKCCCGTEDCEFAQQGRAALEGLNRDVRAAATVGEALLLRHEAYVSDAERQRSRLSESVAKLEESNTELEDTNTHLLEENRALVEQVDGLANASSDADAQIKSLTATLHSAQQELKQAKVLAARAADLEIQLLALEAEQAQLQKSLLRTTEEERSAVQRWREAQRKVGELQDQVDTIDREAQQERDRHTEELERMQKRKTVETLTTAAESGHERRDSSVVSSFVKQILQDNADMQLNMMELQDLLERSRDELDELRRQVSAKNPHEDAPKRDLSIELPQSNRSSKEVHVHHHYHAPQPAARGRAQGQRPRKKRPVLTTGRSTPARTESRASSTSRITTSALGAESSRRDKRWSGNSALTYSTVAPSSMPSSPRSAIFDRSYSDDYAVYSRPTSPESNGLRSPTMKPSTHQIQTSEDLGIQPLSLSSSTAGVIGHASVSKGKNPANAYVRNSLNNTIIEQDETSNTNAKLPTSRRETSAKGTPITDSKTTSRRPNLHRSPSASSLLSISGMDIHTTLPNARPNPQARPSLMPSLSSRQSVAKATLTSSNASVMNSVSRGRAHVQTVAALREKLEGAQAEATPTPTEKREQKYMPLIDTLGGFFSSRWLPGSTAKAPRKDDPKGEAEPDVVSQSSSSSIKTTSEVHNNAAPSKFKTAPGSNPTAPSASLPIPKVDSIVPSVSSSLAQSTSLNEAGGLPPLPRKQAFVKKALDEDALKEALSEELAS